MGTKNENGKSTGEGWEPHTAAEKKGTSSRCVMKAERSRDAATSFIKRGLVYARDLSLSLFTTGKSTWSGRKYGPPLRQQSINDRKRLVARTHLYMKFRRSLLFLLAVLCVVLALGIPQKMAEHTCVSPTPERWWGCFPCENTKFSSVRNFFKGLFCELFKRRWSCYHK